MLVAVAVAVWVAGTLPARAEDSSLRRAFELASLVPDELSETPDERLPEVLSAPDVKLYKDTFRLQEQGDWKAADQRLAKLKDRLLVGRALAQRYLHPRYRSSYKELAAWLDDYADHPEARRIHKLALKRKPKNAKPPRHPVGGSFFAALDPEPPVAAAGEGEPRERLSARERRTAHGIKRRIQVLQRRGQTKALKALLDDPATRQALGQAEYDRARAKLAASHFAEGQDNLALDSAERALKLSARRVPEAHWTAGLAAWRLGRLDEARRHFEAVATSPRVTPWTASAGAFWAARAALIGRRPQEVNRWLEAAADHPRTFYGLLARRMLDLPTEFRWEGTALDREALAALAATPGARRALALIETGEGLRAEEELKLLPAAASPQLGRALLALADRANMASLAVRLGRALYPNGDAPDGTLYPIPAWQPADGFRVDPALIYALIRQESEFNPKAVSPAGARGLMQLMPATASFVAADRSLRNRQDKSLFDPGLNLTLGQRYLLILLNEEVVKGDLFMLAAAWNGGPGNLARWRKKTSVEDDPLLFIESIPSPETRNFIERVLANLWAYQHRLGQPLASLDALAAGDRPVYTPPEKDDPFKVAQNVQDRR